MNFCKIAKRYGPRGTVSRVVYDLTTGLGTTTSVSDVALGAFQPDETGTMVDTLPNKDFNLNVPKTCLTEKGFPVPLIEGDIVEAEGNKVTIRHVREREYKGQVVYFCRAEGA